MAATEVVADTQLPPAVALVSNVVLPAHNTNVPEIAAGVSLTVTVTILKQPEADV
jgi:hypothetical protein